LGLGREVGRKTCRREKSCCPSEKLLTSENKLYASSIIKGSYFNAMLDCGIEHNWWLEVALKYLPRDIFDEHNREVRFHLNGHARRL